MTLSTRYQGTAITEPPTFAGAGGRAAWRVTLDPVGHRARPDIEATLDLFIVRCPGAHPFWDHWAVTAIHLRPMNGVRPAVVRRPGATHELMIISLNPEDPLPGVDGTAGDWRVSFLTPIDVAEQFTAANDAVAAQILELAVTTIVDGVGSPDQDWRLWWSASIQQTAEHFRNGTHGLGRLV